jgi:hypothetical protein
VNADGESLRLVLVLAKGGAAEELSLTFDGDGGAPADYQRRAVAMPAEPRVYGGEADLFAALAEGAPESMHAECSAYFLEGAGPGVAIRPDDYYVVAGAARGRSAGRLLASALRDELAGGASLTGATATAAGRGAAEAVDLVLAGPAGSVTLHVDLDRRGRVVAVERRVSPDRAAGWATAYAHGAMLARLLARSSVTSVRWRTGDRAALVIGLGGGDEHALALDDFLVDDDAAWACGC